MGVDGSLRESRDRTKGKRPRKEQRLVTIIYDYRYLGGRKKLTLITELFSTYMELLYRVSRGKTGEGETGKRAYRHRSQTGGVEKREGAHGCLCDPHMQV